MLPVFLRCAFYVRNTFTLYHVPYGPPRFSNVALNVPSPKSNKAHGYELLEQWHDARFPDEFLLCCNVRLEEDAA